MGFWQDLRNLFSGNSPNQATPLQERQADENGRYSLEFTAHSGDSFYTNGTMTLYDPSGNMVRRYNVASGGGGRGAIPGAVTPEGFDSAYYSNPNITAEYRLDWNDVRRRLDEGFLSPNGTEGYSYTIYNSPNMGELGAAHRNLFRIHTSEYSGSLGCVILTDQRQAEDFHAFMQSLPAELRPQALVITRQQGLAYTPSAYLGNGQDISYNQLAQLAAPQFVDNRAEERGRG